MFKGKRKGAVILHYPRLVSFIKFRIRSNDQPFLFDLKLIKLLLSVVSIFLSVKLYENLKKAILLH
jgi:hypothetical protein